MDSALEYLERHRILEMFENITAKIVYERPGEYYFGIVVALIYFDGFYQCPKEVVL